MLSNTHQSKSCCGPEPGICGTGGRSGSTCALDDHFNENMIAGG